VKLGAKLFLDHQYKHNVRAKRLVVCYRILYAQSMALEGSISSGNSSRQSSSSRLSTLAQSGLGHSSSSPHSRLSIDSSRLSLGHIDSPGRDPSSQGLSRVASRVKLFTHELLPEIVTQTGLVVHDSDPNSIMLALFDALKELNYEWKVLGQYHIKARTFYHLPERSSSPSSLSSPPPSPFSSSASPRSTSTPSHDSTRLRGMQCVDPSHTSAPDMTSHVERVNEGKERGVDMNPQSLSGERLLATPGGAKQQRSRRVALLEPSAEPILRVYFRLYQLPDSSDPPRRASAHNTDAAHSYSLDIRVQHGLAPLFLKHVAFISEFMGKLL
jgi:hypothetical protein